MQYGYFDDAKDEYVITDPRTPVKWINYVGSLSFGGFVDQTGGGVLCKNDPALNRITFYQTLAPASDFRAQTIYLRIHRPGGYQVFSPFYVPTLDDYQRYECRVGLGYSRIVSEFYGVRTQVTIFVPAGADCELRQIEVTNLTGEVIEIDIIPVVEYTHPDALKQLTNADWVPQTMQSKVIEEAGGLKTLVQYPFMLRDQRINYFTANLPAASFETDRSRFLGANGYGSWKAPLALQQPELGNYEALRGDNIAALLIPLGRLAAGESRELVTQLGQATSYPAAQPQIARYRQPAAVQEAFDDLASWWREILAAQQVHTPDPNLDRMVNVHNLRQCVTTLYWSRYLSLYQLGYGARGIGFRDSSQDVMGIFSCLPQPGKELLVCLLSVQKRNGSAMHQFNPLTMIASEGDAVEREDRPHYYSDDHLWAIVATTTYLKETGDFAFLQQVIPFYEKDRDEQPLESGTLLEHLRRGLEFTRTDVGAHGLPLLGFADWNDTVNLAKGAESLFTANLYGRALLEMIELAEMLGDPHSAERCRQDYRSMQARVEACAWDGEWYVRYFDYDGAPIGSKANAAGQIYLNAQSWSVLSGFASPQRARQAMDIVYRRLNTRFGIKLSTPGYNGFDPRVGGITTYPPGAKENGGLFLHPNPWAMIAETMLGDGDRAYQYYDQINPASKNDIIERYEAEPYVYCQNILSDEHPQFGLGRNSWLSGTASWAYQAATRYILGVQPDYHGLRIDPCIPSAWDGFHVERRFRGAQYHIQVYNPQHVCRGVRKVLVNGQPLEGSLIPLQPAGSASQVEVWLG